MYYPILRWKRAEQKALQELHTRDSKEIIPVVEFVPNRIGRGKISTSLDLIQRGLEEARKCWGKRQFILDLGLLTVQQLSEIGNAPFVSIAAQSESLEINPVFTIPSDQIESILHQLDRTKFGRNVSICLRLNCASHSTTYISQQLRDLINSQADIERIHHIILDFKDTTASVEQCRPILEILNDFDTEAIIVASGCFPPDLTGFRLGQHRLERSDWTIWDSIEPQIRTDRLQIHYSDYTTQCANYRPPPEFANFSASIRYTSNQHWVIMRGEGVFNEGGPGYSQWPANARLLIDRAEFCGQDFCYGDNYIWEMATNPKSTGNPETWLRAGINHHLTYVVRQIANRSDVLGR